MLSRIKQIKLAGATRMEKTLGVLALILLLLVIAKTNVLLPFLEKRANIREQIHQQENLYSRYLQIYNQREELKDSYERNLQTIRQIEGKIFTGHDVHVSAAKLQKIVQELAAKNHVMIQRTQTEQPVQISGGLYVISLGVFGQVQTMVDLNLFLEQLEYFKDKFLYAPKLYAKNIGNRITMEIQIFSLAMID